MPYLSEGVPFHLLRQPRHEDSVTWTSYTFDHQPSKAVAHEYQRSLFRLEHE